MAQVFALLGSPCSHPDHTDVLRDLEVLVRFDSEEQLELEDDIWFVNTLGAFNSRLPGGWVASGPLKMIKHIPPQAVKKNDFAVYDPRISQLLAEVARLKLANRVWQVSHRALHQFWDRITDAFTIELSLSDPELIEGYAREKPLFSLETLEAMPQVNISATER